MENASDAIIMAGAVLIFVIALSVAMTVFSQARETVDSVVYASDRTNYYEYLDMDISNNIKLNIIICPNVLFNIFSDIFNSLENKKPKSTPIGNNKVYNLTPTF